MTDVRSGQGREAVSGRDEIPASTPGMEARHVPAAQGGKPIRVVAAEVPFRRRLTDLWASRELFAKLVRKDITVKYKNSALGFLWSMLNPALTLAVFYVVFTFFLRNHIPNFVIYLFAAILMWNLFQTSVLGGTGTIVANAGIVKKVAFPREVLSFASVGSAFVFLLFQSIVLVFFLVVFWHRPAWSAMWLIVPAVLAIVLFAAALSVFLSAVNVYFRDVQHLVEVVLAAWFWAIPGVYPFSGQVHNELAKHHLLWIYFLNPVTPPVMTFQRVFYAWTGSGSPIATYPVSWYALADCAVIAVSLVLLAGAMYVFGRLEGNFAEEL